MQARTKEAVIGVIVVFLWTLIVPVVLGVAFGPLLFRLIQGE